MNNQAPHITGPVSLLDRVAPKRQIEQELSESVSYLGDLADEGVQLLRRSLPSVRTTGDSMVIVVLFRHVLEGLDSVHLLLSHGAVRGSIPILRSMFEASLAIDWILEDREERGRQFYVASLRRTRDWASVLIPGTNEEREVFGQASSQLKQSIHQAGHAGEAQKQVQAIDQHLATQPDLKRINDEFDRRKGKQPYDPYWYQLGGGPYSIGQMAKQLGRGTEYAILYRQWSEVSHASDVRGNIQVQAGGRVVIEPIRTVEKLDTVFNVTTTIVESVLLTMYEEYRPGEADRFKQKFVGEWREKLKPLKIDVQVQIDDPYGS